MYFHILDELVGNAECKSVLAVNLPKYVLVFVVLKPGAENTSYGLPTRKRIA